MNRYCHYCKKELTETEILKQKIYVCHNENCIFYRTNREDGMCKKYAEDSSGHKISYSCVDKDVIMGDDGMNL